MYHLQKSIQSVKAEKRFREKELYVSKKKFMSIKILAAREYLDFEQFVQENKSFLGRNRKASCLCETVKPKKHSSILEGCFL